MLSRLDGCVRLESLGEAVIAIHHKPDHFRYGVVVTEWTGGSRRGIAIP